MLWMTGADRSIRDIRRIRALEAGGLLVALLAAGCAERLADFDVRGLEAVRCTGIDGQGFDLTVLSRLKNPNPLRATVSDVRFQVHSGAHLLGRGRLAGPVEVEPRSEFVLRAPVRVTYASLPADLPARVQDGHLRLRTAVELTARTRLGTFRMRLSSEDRVKIAATLRVAIQGPFRGDGIRIDSIGLAGLKLRRVMLRVRFTAKNLFAFPVRVRRGEFSIAINGAHFGKGTLGPLSLPPRSRASAETRISASHGAVGRAIAAMMGKDPRFRLQGTLWIDPIGGVSELPVDVEADSSIFGTGSIF